MIKTSDHNHLSKIFSPTSENVLASFRSIKCNRNSNMSSFTPPNSLYFKHNIKYQLMIFSHSFLKFRLHMLLLI